MADEEVPDEGYGYNPFDGGDGEQAPKKSKKKKKKKKKSSQSAYDYDDEYDNEAYAGYNAPNESMGVSSSTSSSGGGNDLHRREADLNAKEMRLLQKERELEERERRMGALRGGYMPPNWPCNCYAVAYHDIAVEIPEEYRWLARRFYILMFWTWLCLFMNFVAFFSVWVSDDDSNGAMLCLWSLVYVALGVPCSWKLWYRSLYFGLRDQSGSRWVFFFINFLVHCGFAIMMIVGVPKTASSGLLYMSKQFSDKHKGSGTCCLIAFCMWSVNLLAAVWWLRKAHGTYKRLGMEEEVQKEVNRQMLKAGAQAVSSDYKAM